MAGIYIVAGSMHFCYPKIYLRIMPPYLPAHRKLVYTSGLSEILLGMGLLFPSTKDMAVYGIMLMLTLFLTIHVHMLADKKAAMGLPGWLLILRIPMQFALMYWAYNYL